MELQSLIGGTSVCCLGITSFSPSAFHPPLLCSGGDLPLGGPFRAAKGVGVCVHGGLCVCVCVCLSWSVGVCLLSWKAGTGEVTRWRSGTCVNLWSALLSTSSSSSSSGFAPAPVACVDKQE